MTAHEVLHSTNISLLESSSFIAEIQLALPSEAEGKLLARKGPEVCASKYIHFGCPSRFPGRLIQAFLVKSGQPSFAVKA